MNNHIVTIMATEHDGSNTRNIAINLNILDENPGNFDIKDAVRKAVHEYLCTDTIDVDWDEQLADDDALNDFWHKDDEE